MFAPLCYLNSLCAKLMRKDWKIRHKRNNRKTNKAKKLIDVSIVAFCDYTKFGPVIFKKAKLRIGVGGDL